MPDALKLADAFEKFASHIDATHGVPQREAAAQSAARVEKIAAHYRAELGSGYTDEMHERLLKAGSAELDMHEKIASARQPPASLGGASAGSTGFPSPGRVDPIAEFTAQYSGPAR